MDATICGLGKAKGSETGSAVTWGRKREARNALGGKELTGKGRRRRRTTWFRRGIRQPGGTFGVGFEGEMDGRIAGSFIGASMEGDRRFNGRNQEGGEISGEADFLDEEEGR